MKYEMKLTILIPVVISALLLSCSPGDDVEEVSKVVAPKEMHDSQKPMDANTVHLSADQQGVVGKHGAPESFKLIVTSERVNQVEKVTRVEIWNYYRLKTSFSFIDGNLEAEAEIEDVPNWTLLPVIYRPEQFSNEMSLKEVKKKIIGDRPYESLDLPDDLLPGSQLTIIGSEQIMLGFEQGKLIYVETIPLFPNADEKNEEGAE